MEPLEFAPWLGVFETLRVIDGVPLFVPEHRAELQRSATALGLTVQLDLARAARELAGRTGRWRWLVTPHETRTLFSDEQIFPNVQLAVAVSTVRVGSQNWDARFKTVSYLAHIQALRMGPVPEMILLNEHGHVASAARANIFWRKGRRLYTPAHEAGCRCGVVRGFVFAQDVVEEGHFALNELVAADEIFLTNSLRGIVSVNALEGETRTDFSHADELRRKYDQAVNAIRSYGGQ
jgi:branched-subunit amino acid aminotransferase/4-amino-4-deoxychorismate lyase